MSSSSSLKTASDGQIDLMMMNAPMRLLDAVSMFRTPISKNERPMEAEIKKANNAVVEKWNEEILKPLADHNASIPAGRVDGCLRYYLEGKELEMYAKYKEHLPQPDKEMAMYWL